MRSYILGTIIACLLCAVTGAYSSAWLGIEIRYELDAGDLFAAITTLATAIFITWYLQRFLNSHEREKDFLVGELDEALRTLAALDAPLTGQQFTDPLAKIKRIHMRIDHLQGLIPQLRCRGISPEDVNFVADLNFLRSLCGDQSEAFVEHLHSGSDRNDFVLTVSDDRLRVATGRQHAYELRIAELRRRLIEAKVQVIAL